MQKHYGSIILKKRMILKIKVSERWSKESSSIGYIKLRQLRYTAFSCAVQSNFYIKALQTWNIFYDTNEIRGLILSSIFHLQIKVLSHKSIILIRGSG